MRTGDVLLSLLDRGGGVPGVLGVPGVTGVPAAELMAELIALAFAPGVDGVPVGTACTEGVRPGPFPTPREQLLARHGQAA